MCGCFLMNPLESIKTNKKQAIKKKNLYLTEWQISSIKTTMK